MKSGKCRGCDYRELQMLSGRCSFDGFCVRKEGKPLVTKKREKNKASLVYKLIAFGEQ